MEEILQTLTNQISQLFKEKKEYLANKKEETFTDDQTRKEDELILQGENVLDRKSNMKERIDKISKLKRMKEL